MGILTSQPFHNKTFPCSSKRALHNYTREPFKIVEERQRKDICIVTLAGFTYMCISEVFALRWENIDFKKNTISIRSQYILGRILEYTKTK